MYTAAQMDTRLHKAGFGSVQQRANIGHNSARMTFLARNFECRINCEQLLKSITDYLVIIEEKNFYPMHVH
jgi:hypothetical protein